MDIEFDNFIKTLIDKYNLPKYIDSFDAKGKIFDEIWSGENKSIYITFQDNTYTYATLFCDEARLEEPTARVYAEDVCTFSHEAWEEYRQFQMDRFHGKEKEKRKQAYLILKKEFENE